MANSAVSQILEDGARQTVVNFQGVIDTSDLASTVVVDPAVQFIDPINPTTQYRVDRIEFSIQDPIVVRLWWDASTPVKMVELAGRGFFWLGRIYGGLQNNAGAGKTGKITATTVGYTSGALSFTVILRCVKQ